MSVTRSNSGKSAADVDDVAVARAVAGDRDLVLTYAEIHAAIATLTGRGWSVSRIAEHLGVASRTVQRHRAAS